MAQAISREMEARGYQRADNPDLLINVSARLEDKTKVTTYNDPYPGGTRWTNSGVPAPDPGIDMAFPTVTIDAPEGMLQQAA